MRLDWNKLITSKRLGTTAPNLQADARNEFERDVDRIIFSSAFRRLQDKTQVFPIPKSDFIHSRLTHSIEVASVGRSLGKLIGKFILKTEGLIKDAHTGEDINPETFSNIIAAACMCHDIGNPPFGHSGEDAFRNYFENYQNNSSKDLFERLSNSEKEDFLRFEGNAEGFRILTNDHPSGYPGGLKMTYTTLAAFSKYTCEAGKLELNKLGYSVNKRRSSKKVGVFQEEKRIFNEIAVELELLKLSNKQIYFCRHPLSFILEAADNISYQVMDLEDGHKLGLISTNEVVELLKPFVLNIKNDPCNIDDLLSINDDYEKVGAFRAKAINSLIYQCYDVFEKNYSKIMTGEFDSELTDLIEQKNEFEKLDEIKKEKLFSYYKVVAIESSGRHVISGLLELYLDAYKNIKKKYGENIINMLPPHYRPSETDRPYVVLLKISSYLSRMTDSFAIDQFRSLTGHKFPDID
ncbi:dNTP triphosphohydrolase [Flavobacterium silvisoli]|uniref:DNTP triphosphohydrolase n=1 Tax=Flavobacterium silvisoli TaxID=2529433 RepID=A0A4Q9Z0B9_9FLAO|nr:dNTP triphosphohydrolase [Flavobacterium silvisoli]TBX69620.1 dNTP triphosphohydrolase [Flavobacterium silvisoli]